MTYYRFYILFLGLVLLPNESRALFNIKKCSTTCITQSKVCSNSKAAKKNREWCQSAQSKCSNPRSSKWVNSKTNIPYLIQNYYWGDQTDWDLFFEDVCNGRPFNPLSQSTFSDQSVFQSAFHQQDDLIKDITVFARMSYGVTREDFINDISEEDWTVRTFPKGATGGKVAGFIAYKDKQFIISFRGTESKYDAITDVRIIKASASPLGLEGKVHRGFLFYFQKLFPEVKSIIFEMLSEQRLNTKDVEYFMTGHSLGGALASVAAAAFVNDRQLVAHRPNMIHHQVKVVTIASPRAFSKDAAAHYSRVIGNRNTLRFWIFGDPVPALPHGWAGFKHVGTSIRLNTIEDYVNKFKNVKNFMHIQDNTVGMHSAEGYVDLVKKTFQEYKKNPSSHIGFKSQVRKRVRSVIR